MRNRSDVRSAFIAESDRRETTIHLLIREINAELDELNSGEISGSKVADDFHDTKWLIKAKLNELKNLNQIDI